MLDVLCGVAEKRMHAHILLWMMKKIRPNEIDAIICAGIPVLETDPELYEVMTTNIINEPCGDHNRESPCTIENKCSKRYPHASMAYTITGNDGYSLYRRRSAEYNSRTITLKIKNKDVVVENSWIVPNSPLLSKTFKAHCNVEYYNSVKSIKYVCKYVTKGSDIVVFGIAAPDSNDDVRNIRYLHMSATMRRFRESFHSSYTNVILLWSI